MAEPVDQLLSLRERQDAFEASIPLVPSDTPVPWCGDWVVRDLVVHLAEVHQGRPPRRRGVRSRPSTSA